MPQGAPPVTDALPASTPTAMMFLDETGAIAQDRFFAVGCLKVPEPSVLLRALQTLRDRNHWYNEIHWVRMTRTSLPFYKQVVDVVAATPTATFACFVADRNAADPLSRFRTPWKAYEKLATQLIIGNISPGEIVGVLADNYSTPHNVSFETDVKAEVNRRLGRLGVISVCRLDSKAADCLQIVDLLTAAVAFEFRASAGLASSTTPKAELADYVRQIFGAPSFLSGFRSARLNVALYRNALPPSSRRPRRTESP